MSLNKKALIRSHCPPLFHEASIGGALSLRKRSHSNLDIQSYDPGWACGEFGASFFMLSSFEFICFVEYAPISFTVKTLLPLMTFRVRSTGLNAFFKCPLFFFFSISSFYSFQKVHRLVDICVQRRKGFWSRLDFPYSFCSFIPLAGMPLELALLLLLFFWLLFLVALHVLPLNDNGFDPLSSSLLFRRLFPTKVFPNEGTTI